MLNPDSKPAKKSDFPMTQQRLTELLLEVREGNQSSLCLILSAFHATCEALATRYLGHYKNCGLDLQDVLAEQYSVLFRRIHQKKIWQPDIQLAAFYRMLQLTTRSIASGRSRRADAQTSSLDQSPREPTVNTINSLGMGPLTTAEELEKLQRLARTLPPKRRDAYMLASTKPNWSDPERAAALGVSLEAFRASLRRAYADLLALYEEQEE